MSPPDSTPKPDRGWLKLVALVVCVVGFSLLIRWTGVLNNVSVADIYRARDSAGVFAPAAFIVIYIVGTLFAFPGLLLTLAGGLLFGTFLGGAIVVVGASIGAVGAFLISRYAGRSTVERFMAGGAVERFDRTVSGSGFSAVLFTRLVPVFPFNIVNFAWGLSGVALRDYTLATVIGIIPAVFVYANIAAAIGRTLHDADAPLTSIDVRAFVNRDVIVAFAFLGVLAILPPVFKFIQSRRSRQSGDASQQ